MSKTTSQGSYRRYVTPTNEEIQSCRKVESGLTNGTIDHCSTLDDSIRSLFRQGKTVDDIVSQLFKGSRTKQKQEFVSGQNGTGRFQTIQVVNPQYEYFVKYVNRIVNQ